MLVNDLNELKQKELGKMEKQYIFNGRMCENDEKECEVKCNKGMEEKDNLVQFIGNFILEDKISKEGEEEKS